MATSRWRVVFTDVIPAVAMTVAAAAILWTVFRKPTPPAPPAAGPDPAVGMEIALNGAARQGSASAPVALLEFADYECPACRQIEQTVMPDVHQRFVETGKVLLILKHLPLPQHRFAARAAEAAACAARQDQFWPVHAGLFAAPVPLDDAAVLTTVQQVALDQKAFVRCWNASTSAADVRSDLDQARALQASGTPTFFIGRPEPGDRLKILGRLKVTRIPDSLQTGLEKWLATSDVNHQ